MQSLKSFFLALGMGLLIVGLFAAAATGVGKGAKPAPKSEPSGAEPWVAGYTLKQWVQFYRTGNAEQKERAVQMIAWCCTQKRSADAAKVMIEVLQDEKHRVAACKAIGGMGWEGRIATTALVPCASSKEKSPEARLAAIDALGSIGLTRPGVLDVLIEALHDRDDGVRRTAGYAIYRIGVDARPLVPDLIKALKDREAVVAESAAKALAGIGPDARDAALALIEALKHPNMLVRRQAVGALQRLCSDDPAVHKALVAALQDENGEVSAGAVWALHFCRNIGDEVVDGLCWALQHGNASQRYYAANAMSELGIESPKTIASLVAALKDKKTRAVAATALGKRKPVAEATLSALMEAFEKDNRERVAIANALAEMGPAAESTARRLKQALKEHEAEVTWSHEWIHVAAADAVWKITRDRDMILVLAKLARYSRDHHVANGALRTLADIGPEAKAAAPELIAALKSPSESAAAAWALARIGAPEGEAALGNMLTSEDAKKRLQAAHALWEVKHDPKALAQLCETALRHQDRYERRHAVIALAKASPNDELAILHLAQALDDDCPWVQKEAAQGLGRFGKEARLAVRALGRLLAGDSWSVADQAARTLGKLGPDAAKALPQLRRAAQSPFLRDSATEAIKRIER